MAFSLRLCETFLKRSCRPAATVVAALIALAGVPVADVEARQATPPPPPAAAHASERPAQPPAPGAAHAAPVADEKVEAAKPAADPAHGAAQPAHDGQAPAPAATSGHAPAADAAHGQPPAHGPPAAGGAHDAAAAHDATAGGHDQKPKSIWEKIGPYVNFLILAGGLFYFLRQPISEYLANRDQQIRGGLVSARDTADRATAQIAEIDKRLQALPAELDALRKRGVAEIAAEERRIQDEAAAERARLLDDMQRDVDLRVRVARKMLTERTADLVVTLAAQRVKETITDAEQAKLVDRYTTQVKDIHG